MGDDWRHRNACSQPAIAESSVFVGALLGHENLTQFLCRMFAGV